MHYDTPSRDAVSSAIPVCTTQEMASLASFRFAQPKRRRLWHHSGLYNARDGVSGIIQVCMAQETPSLALYKSA